MKNLLYILIISFMFSSINAQQYRENKNNFNYKDYTYEVNDRYDPKIAGVASFLVPGLGQVLAGETLRGVSYFGGYIVTYSIILGGINQKSSLVNIGILGMTTIWIWSIIDAVRVAKVNNLALRDKHKKKVSIRVYPALINTKSSGEVVNGIGLKIKL